MRKSCSGASFDDALPAALKSIARPLGITACTSLIAAAVLMFADYGKFQQAGLATTLALLCVLLSVVLLIPALLRFGGRWVFWPDLRQERLAAGAEWLPTVSLTRWIADQQWSEKMWKRSADLIGDRPGRLLAVSSLVLALLTACGCWQVYELSYGMLTDLPDRYPSAIGAEAVQSKFPAGMLGSTIVLVQHSEFDLTPTSNNRHLRRSHPGRQFSREIVDQLRPQMPSLGLSEIRAQAYPLGISAAAMRLDAQFTLYARRMLVHESQKLYAGTQGPAAGKVLKLEFILSTPPFSHQAITRLPDLEQAVRDSLPRELRDGAEISSLGPTASLRDLKQVTGSDTQRTFLLTIVAVGVSVLIYFPRPILVVLLLGVNIAVCFAALGLTCLLAGSVFRNDFDGLDWNLPIWLFTLVCGIVGDPHRLLAVRVAAEQRIHPGLAGVQAALRRSGGIITGFGFALMIPAVALLASELTGLVELGVALIGGVLLDLFIVRAIMLPAVLSLFYQDGFGLLGRWLQRSEGTQPLDSPPGGAVQRPGNIEIDQQAGTVVEQPTWPGLQSRPGSTEALTPRERA
ncbi:MAG: MMPL family transporter [Planctomycetaceae bacterium]